MSPAPKLAGVNLTTNPPHNTRIEVNFGRLSLLFSYGSVIGYDYLDGPKVLEELNRHQRKHTNQWRRFDKQQKLPFNEFTIGYLTALTQESDQLTYTLLQEPTMAENDEEIKRSPIDDDLDTLDTLDEEDLDDGLDDDDDDDDDLDDDDEDDFDDEDEDDDDGFDDEDEDDEEED